jgi:GST-like protein
MMIDFYTWNTPNGQKVQILLEELGEAYKTTTVHIGKNEQFAPEFLKISPNNKIPAVVVHEASGEDIAVFESGAILIFLAERRGRFIGAPGSAARAEQLQWLMFQMGGVGPMFGQLGHFTRVAPQPQEYALKRFGDEVARLVGVMERHLQRREYFAGEYSIADMALFPWLRGLTAYFGYEAEKIPHISAWIARIDARPAVQRAMTLSKECCDEHRPTFTAPV